MINVTIIPVLDDNYAYLLEGENGETGIVDPGEAAPVILELERRGLRPDIIFNTHHHGDHIAGNAEFKRLHDAKLAAPEKEQSRIDGIDIKLAEGTSFSFGGEPVHILETPGHTRGGLCIHFPESKILFTGDTLFSMGCGRLFEGTPAQMWESFGKIKALPDETQIFCGHEYTLSNGEFCLCIEPDNPALRRRMEEVRTLRDQGQPTLPVTLGIEKQTNAFLRAGSAERFAELRALKDRK